MTCLNSSQKNGMLKVLLITNLVIYSSIYITKIFPKKIVKNGTVKINYCEEKERLVSSCGLFVPTLMSFATKPKTHVNVSGYIQSVTVNLDRNRQGEYRRRFPAKN